jgi:hypothetical protein
MHSKVLILNKNSLKYALYLIILLTYCGCSVFAVGDAIVSTGASVVSAGASVVSTGVKAASSAVDAVLPDSKSEKK